jgi:hypothetical protein
MKAVFDTNILIDYLNGIPNARTVLLRYRDPWISIITRMEVLVGVTSGEGEEATRRFLARFRVRSVDDAICEQGVLLRKTYGLRVPDAIVYATAREQGCLLVTRDVRSFPMDEVDVHCPYRV